MEKWKNWKMSSRNRLENGGIPDKTSLFPGIQPRIGELAVFVISFLCYSVTLGGSFVFDDTEAVVNNMDVKGPDVSLGQLFVNDFWGTSLYHKASHKSYRPLTVLTFRLNYVMNGLDPRAYHLTNLVLYSISCTLALKVFAIVFGENQNGRRLHPYRLSFVAAILFAIHPIHTESVAAIVGRADLLCAIFFFLSITNYVDHLRTSSATSFTCSMIHCGVAMLCKEQGITVLGVLFVYDVLCCHLTPNGKILKRSAILLVTGTVLLYGRWRVMGSAPPAFQPVDNPASYAPSWQTRALSYNYVYAIHSLLLLWPHWLCFDWSMGCVPLVRHCFQDGRLVAIFLFWIIWLTAGFRAIRQRRSTVLSLGLSVMAVPFLPATNLFFRVGFVVAERILFIPVAGYSLIVAQGAGIVHSALQRRGNSKWTAWWRCCLLATAAILAAKSSRRCLDWLDETHLFASGLSVCPLNAKVHYNVGKNLADRGDRQGAMDRYRRALELHPDYDQAMNNLANLLKDGGRHVEAETWLLKAVALRPDFAAAWMNLGIVQAMLKKHQLAHTSYLTALNHRRKYPDCHYNLGNLYLELEKFGEAEESFRNAIALNPTHVLAWTNLIVMLDNIGDLERAESTAVESIRLIPDDANLHFSLAGILGKKGRFSRSEFHFLEAIKINGGTNAVYHTNLGVLYHRWKRYQLARECYDRALFIDPLNKSAQENLKLLYTQYEKSF